MFVIVTTVFDVGMATSRRDALPPILATIKVFAKNAVVPVSP